MATKKTKPTEIDTTKTYLGTCQACFNQQVTKGSGPSLVLHGYQRPGWGSIHGQCMGVGELPYELSCDATKRWKSICQDHLGGLEEGLAQRKANKLAEYTISVTDYSKRRGWGEKRDVKRVTLKRGESYTCDYLRHTTTFEDARQTEIRGFERNIRDLTAHIAQVAQRIAAWVYAPERLQLRAEVETAEKAAKAQAAARKQVWRNLRENWKDLAGAIQEHKSGYTWQAEKVPGGVAWMKAHPFPGAAERKAARDRAR